jgi:asparagine synthetase B (glutamine-hydrolysing)
MCGIHLRVWKDASCVICSKIFSDKDSNLQNRGPDACQSIEPTQNYPQYHQIRLQASVLKMRQELVTQPVKIHDNTFLCWNGEIYETCYKDEMWQYETSDTLLVAEQLESAFENENDGTTSKRIAEIMAKLYNAEFAVLVLTKSYVYYGRDLWGRRSLLRWDCPKGCGSFQIVSTAESLDTSLDGDDGIDQGQNWSEILPGMVHQTPLTQEMSFTSNIPYPPISPTSTSPIDTPNLTIRTSPPEGVSEELWAASVELECHLRRAVKMRLDQKTSSAVLFSGGLDSAVVAALAAELCIHPLYLYNVSFGPTYMKSNDRKAALVTAAALQKQYPEKKIVFQDIVVDWEDIQHHEPHIRTLLQPKSTLMDVNIGTALWFASQGGDHRIGESDGAVPRVLLLGMGADEQLGETRQYLENS